MLGASRNTAATSCTKLMINNSCAVLYTDSTERTRLDTVTETDTSIFAALIAAAKLHFSKAIGGTVIVNGQQVTTLPNQMMGGGGMGGPGWRP